MTKKFFVLLVFLILSFNLWAQENNSLFPLELKDKIPVDKAVTVGKLSNGLTYYIHPNKTPEKYAELKLVIKAGSVQEEDDQRGLAHFLVHLALQGTKNISKQQLTDFFTSIEMKYGPDLSATASFSETTYSLQIPTDSLGIIQKSFDILKEWAHNISFDSDVINKERSVVLGELNTGLSTTDNIFQKQAPYIFKNSRYAERSYLGKKNVLESFTPETIKQYYSDWYRPDLMAVVVVGDIEKNKIEELIKRTFEGLKNPINPKPLIEYPIQEHKDTLISVLADKNITSSTLLIHHKFLSTPDIYVQDLRNKIPVTLFSIIFNQRMSLLKSRPEFPVASSTASQGMFVANNSIFTFDAQNIKENEIPVAVNFLLTECEKIKRFGFLEKELIWAKGTLIRAVQFESLERKSYETSSLANKYVRNFVLQETAPGIDFEFAFTRKYLQTISLEDLNNIIPSLLKDKNIVVTISLPEKEGLRIPTESEILDIMRKIKNKELFPYDEEIANRPLLEKDPIPGSITKEKQIKEIGATEWTLSNGVKVVFKPTDFKDTEILMFASSPGGKSLIPQRDYNSVRSASDIIANSGVGNFTSLDLRKYLSGKPVSVYPFMDELYSGLQAHCSPFDFETMLKLTHLYFTSPRKDNSDFKNFLNKVSTTLDNQGSLTENIFQDSVDAIFYNHNPRNTQLTKDNLQQLDLDKSYNFYRERYSNAGNFTFFFVGNFTQFELKNLVEKYIASLPSSSKRETWKDNKITYAQGVEKKIYKGSDSKSIVQLIYRGKFKYSFQNCLELSVLQKVLNEKLTTLLLDKKVKPSDVAVEITPEHFPKERVLAKIKVKSSVKKINGVNKLIETLLDSLKRFVIPKSVMQKVKDSLKKENSSNISSNKYWLQMISSSYQNNTDPKLILSINSAIDKFSATTIQKWAKEIFGKNNFVKIALYPETKK